MEGRGELRLLREVIRGLGAQNGRVEGLTEWRGGPGVDRMKDEHVGEGAKQQLLVSCEQRALRREVSLRVDLGMGAEE